MNFIHFDKQTIGMRVTFARRRQGDTEREGGSQRRRFVCVVNFWCLPCKSGQAEGRQLNAPVTMPTILRLMEAKLQMDQGQRAQGWRGAVTRTTSLSH